MYPADLIRAQMGARDLSQAQVAAESGLNINTVAAVCRGKEEIKIPTLKKVAAAVGLEMEIRLTPMSKQD